jgi:PiT family inorganic phosphate transporter
VLAVVVIALIFEFTCGFNDSGGIVATMVYTGAMGARTALFLAAFLEFIGAVFLGTAVAATFTTGIVNAADIDVLVVFSALFGALIWNITAALRGIPSSSTHALIGGILGAVLISAGYDAIHWVKIAEVLLVLIMSPIIGLVGGFFLTRLSYLLLGRVSPMKVRKLFLRTQVLSSAALALSHGTNDAQKTMGVITLTLVILYPLSPEVVGLFYQGGGEFYVPLWVKVCCAAAISLGVLIGGSRIMKTLGGSIYKVRPVHGFSAQASSASVIYASALLGFPVSTTQVISSSIVGAGTAQRVSAVRWNVVQSIIATWLITIPATTAMGGVVYFLLHYIFVTHYGLF